MMMMMMMINQPLKPQRIPNQEKKQENYKLHHCTVLLSFTVINTMSKSNLGSKGIWNWGRSHGWMLQIWLFFMVYIHSYTNPDHHSTLSTTHREVDLPTLMIKQGNLPQTCTQDNLMALIFSNPSSFVSGWRKLTNTIIVIPNFTTRYVWLTLSLLVLIIESLLVILVPRDT